MSSGDGKKVSMKRTQDVFSGGGGKAKFSGSQNAFSIK